MPIVAPIEKFYMEKMLEKGHKEGHAKGIEEGREEGREEGILIEAQTSVVDILNDRFGEPSPELMETLQGIADLPLLRNLRRQSIKVKSLDEFERLIKNSNG